MVVSAGAGSGRIRPVAETSSDRARLPHGGREIRVQSNYPLPQFSLDATHTVS